jgi:hypothetical protein
VCIALFVVLYVVVVVLNDKTNVLQKKKKTNDKTNGEVHSCSSVLLKLIHSHGNCKFDGFCCYLCVYS